MAASTVKVFPPLDTDPAYYNDWSFRCKALLRRKKCLEVLSESRPTTGTDEESLAIAQEAYDEKNDMAFGYITDHIQAMLYQRLKQSENQPKNYENKSVSNQLNILTRLINLHMNEGSSLDLHYATLDSIVSELRLAGAKTADDKPLLTALLLGSMPPSFNTAVTAIRMSLQETPTFEGVRKKLKDHALSVSLQKEETKAAATVMTATTSFHQR